MVSRDFIAASEDISTVICAPVFSKVLGLQSEVTVGSADGLPRESSVRCDFLTLMFKKRLTGFVSTLSPEKQMDLKRALSCALQVK